MDIDQIGYSSKEISRYIIHNLFYYLDLKLIDNIFSPLIKMLIIFEKKCNCI